MLDWLADWWPVLIPMIVFLIGAVLAFAYLDADDAGDTDDGGLL